MRTITIKQMISITTELFKKYIEPTAISMMSGEVPNSTFVIHRDGSTDSEWLAQVRFKNTLTISMFHCDVYLEDVMRFCRWCKLYLITEEVFRVAVLYTILHPLYQNQYMNFEVDANTDYDSMMAGAGEATYMFIEHHAISRSDILMQTILDIININSMILSNTYKYAPKNISIASYLDELLEDYAECMAKYRKEAFRSAKYLKAQTHLVDEEGFILLEPRTNGGTKYYGKEKEYEQPRKSNSKKSQ